MIRDPSDGSVREAKSKAWAINTSFEPSTEPNPDLKGITVSGLPFGSTKPEQLARLEKSRNWLKDYHEKNGAINESAT